MSPVRLFGDENNFSLNWYFRVLINLEQVGDFGDRKEDIICLGKCDSIVRELARKLGWEEALQKAWEATADSLELEEAEATPAVKMSKEESNRRERGLLQAEVDKLTGDVEKSLTLTDDSTGGEKETTNLKLCTDREELAAVLQTPATKNEKLSVRDADGAESSGGSKAQ